MIEELKFREKELRRVRNKLYDKDFKERSCEDSDSEEKIKTIKCEESKAEVDEDEDEFSKQDIKTIVSADIGYLPIRAQAIRGKTRNRRPRTLV